MNLNTALWLLLPQALWPEVAFPNASSLILNTALELLLPRTTFVARGSIHQRVSICWQPSRGISTLRWSYFCLGQLSQPEVAFTNAFLIKRFDGESQHCVGATFASDFMSRGSILQRTPLGNVPIANHNTALKLLLLLTHSVMGGSILQHIHIRHCATSLLLATAVEKGATPQRPCFHTPLVVDSWHTSKKPARSDGRTAATRPSRPPLQREPHESMLVDCPIDAATPTDVPLFPAVPE